jgi:hypothetical protein
VNPNLARQVWQRARSRCEYCHLPASRYPLPFHIDHVIARQHGGATSPENLALACLHCNRHKGPNIAGRLPETGDIVRLFHPRLDSWSDHFEWDGPILSAKTDVGLVTIQVLAINEADFVAVRLALMQEGEFHRG